MEKYMELLLFLFASVNALASANAPSLVQKTFYVSTIGDDSWSGLLPSPNPTNTDGPFLTPLAAQLAVLSVPRPLTGQVIVYIRESLVSCRSQ